MKLAVLLPEGYDLALLRKANGLARAAQAGLNLRGINPDIAFGLPQGQEQKWRRDEAALLAGVERAVVRHVVWERMQTDNARRMCPWNRRHAPEGLDTLTIARDWGTNFIDCDLWFVLAEPAMGAVFTHRPTANFCAGLDMGNFGKMASGERIIQEQLAQELGVSRQPVQQALTLLRKQGIEVMLSSEVTKVDTSGKGCKVTVKSAAGEKVIECDIVLSAVGIAANIEGIGLEAVGIVTDKGKIKVNDMYATNIPGYYAIGDATPGQALAHVASAEGIICVEAIAGQKPHALDYGNIPGCTYCSPEVASVGMTEKQCKEKGLEIKVGKFPFSASGKASAAGAKDGFVKLIFDAKYGELLGAHMIGYNVTEMIAECVSIRKLETTGHEIIKTVHPHPTMSEAIMEAAAAAYGEVIHL